jgi:hypothetical protein
MKNAIILVFTLFLINCDNYGTMLEFNGGELYYTSSVSEREAYKLGEYLVDAEFFDGDGKTIQLNKTGNTYEFRMVIKKGTEKDEEFIQIAKIFANDLSEYVFNGFNVDIHLCDENLSTIRVVVPLLLRHR